MRTILQVVRSFTNPKVDRRHNGFHQLTEIPVGMRFICWRDAQGQVFEVAEVTHPVDTTTDYTFIDRLVASSTQVQD